MRTLLAMACLAVAVSHFAEAPADPAASVSPQPQCTDAAVGEPCWLGVEERPNCHVLQRRLPDRVTLLFDGAAHCPNGKLSGTGSVTARRQMGGTWYSWQAQGTYVEGRRHGQWTMVDPAGSRHEGPFVDGQAQGKWAIARKDGSRLEGPMVGDRRHGLWVTVQADGDRFERTYVEGRIHGPAVLHFSIGQRHEGPYVDGRAHGRWVITQADGSREEGPFLHGKRNGQWLRQNADGSQDQLVYMDDLTTWTVMQKCDSEAVRNALSAGFDVEARSSPLGLTALWDAATHGCHEIVPVLLQAGSDPNVEVDDRTHTLGRVVGGHLSRCEENAHLKTIEAMIAGGLVLRPWHEPPDTILHSMAYTGSICSVSTITAVIGMVMAQTGVAIDAPGKHGLTPLHVAVYERNHTVAIALLDLGADPTARTDTGKTPLAIIENGEHPLRHTRLHMRLRDAESGQP